MGMILPTVENACAIYVQQTIVSQSLSMPVANVYTGIDNDIKDLPEVICYAEEAEPLYKETDWWKVKANIIVVYNAARSSRGEATSVANTIFDAFFDVSASVYLTNATSSFTCAEVFDKKYINNFEQDAWVQSVSFTMLVCPSD